MNESVAKRPRRKAGSRSAPRTGTVSGILEDVRSEVECLQEEMSEWRGNLEGSNMEHLPKYDEVTEAHDAVESLYDALPEDAPECLQDCEVRYTQDTRQSAWSRAGRLSNAESAFSAMKAEAEDWLESNPELELVEGEDDDGNPWTADDLDDSQTLDGSAVDERDEQRSSVREFIEQLEEAEGMFGDVGFPGMY